ncbi:hypothetical protein DMENIID0001_118580 [Sergentomyia squamirostris]
MGCYRSKHQSFLQYSSGEQSTRTSVRNTRYCPLYPQYDPARTGVGDGDVAADGSVGSQMATKQSHAHFHTTSTPKAFHVNPLPFDHITAFSFSPPVQE